MAAAVEGAQVDVDTALRIESRYFHPTDSRSDFQEHDDYVLAWFKCN